MSRLSTTFRWFEKSKLPGCTTSVIRTIAVCTMWSRARDFEHKGLRTLHIDFRRWEKHSMLVRMLQYPMLKNHVLRTKKCPSPSRKYFPFCLRPQWSKFDACELPKRSFLCFFLQLRLVFCRSRFQTVMYSIRSRGVDFRACGATWSRLGSRFENIILFNNGN